MRALTIRQCEEDVQQLHIEGMRQLCAVLMERLLTTAERERRQLASIIHDEALQLGCQVERLLGETLAKGTLSAEAWETMGEALSLTRLLVEQLRTVASGLYPPSPAVGGLPQALRSMLEQIERRTALHCVWLCDMEAERWYAGIEGKQVEMLYSMAREAILNAVKHAEATTVQVKLRRDNAILMVQVEDDGKGFSVAADDDMSEFLQRGHLGLALLKERAQQIGGSVEIRRGSPGGTCVTMRVPLATRATGSGKKNKTEENENI